MSAKANTIMTDDWVDIGPLEAIPPLGARVVRTRQGDIAVFRTREGELYALDDACPHRGGPLSQGIVSGCVVTCPLHNWCIRLDQGSAVEPDEGSVKTYEVRLDQDRILLRLPAGS